MRNKVLLMHSRRKFTTLARKCKAQSDSDEEGTDCAGNIVLYGNKDCNCYVIKFNNNCCITVLGKAVA